MSGRSTSEALLDAAEERFARDGFQAASLRAVMRAAGSDPGSIHYHFGGREELAAAVLDRVLAPINARRIELLEIAVDRADPGPVALEALIAAIVVPDLELATDLNARGAGRARLLGEIYVNPARFVTTAVERLFAPVADRFMPHLLTAVPHVPSEIVAWRVRWCVFGVLGALLSDDREPFSIGLDELTSRIVTTGAATIAAPVLTEGRP